ncbi:MAG: hypothetical protein R3B84_23205 [Zavarzinella sp.]
MTKIVRKFTLLSVFSIGIATVFGCSKSDEVPSSNVKVEPKDSGANISAQQQGAGRLPKAPR